MAKLSLKVVLAGHIGAALALNRLEQRLNLGALILAAMLLDLLLWLFVLFGIERVRVPAHYAELHYFTFDFPYSHGLLGSLVWSASAAGVAWFASRELGAVRPRATLLIGAAVFSHWLLDALVHVPELRLAGAGSPRVGLALWNHMPLALTVEILITAAGLWLYLSAIRPSPGRRIGLIVFTAALAIATVIGMTLAPAPTDLKQLAVASLATNVVIVAIACWLGRLSQ